MSDVEAVGGLPGGRAFLEMWQQVNGDEAGIDAVTARLRTAATGTQGHAGRIAAATASAQGGWKGGGAQALEASVARYGTAASSVEQGLTSAAAALTYAAAEVGQAKQQLQSIAGRILDAAARISRLPQSPSLPTEAQLIERAVTDGCAEAAPYVSNLSTNLTSAAGDVRRASATGAFTALPSPGVGAYLPTSGSPLGWVPQPHQDSGTTDPSSATPGGGSSSGGGSGPAGHGGGGTGAAGSGVTGTGSGAPSAVPTGDVATWINQAAAILQANGVPASKINDRDINLIIQHESGGNPHAINEWDSNAAKGTPSKGLMQTIDPTFNSYALPGHQDVWNPVDNIIAGVRYALAQYGSLDAVPGVAGVRNGSGYQGY